MDSNTPLSYRSEPRSRTKSASRLVRTGYFSIEGGEEIPHLSVGIISSPPKKTPSNSAQSLRSSSSVPIQELLLSPPPHRRSRTRLTDRLEMAEDPMEPIGHRKRSKTRASQLGLLGCASPRGSRRSRRKSEMESREERDLLLAEEIGKVRKRRHNGRSSKENLSLVPSIPSSSSSPKSDEEDLSSLDHVGQLISDMVMWKDVAKSSLWFGFGFLCFFSSCFARGVTFSFFAVISQLGLLFLGVSFFSNSICQSNNTENKHRFKLKEDDIVRIVNKILPAANLAVTKTKYLFSGEPSMTLKVAPFLLLGSEYGHLITLWRLSAIGFFTSFTIPKLYSSYYVQINKTVDCLKWRLIGAWDSCSYKKTVVVSAATAFWNLSTMKTRIFTVFLSLVILQYCRQYLVPNLEGGVEEEEEQKHALALTVKNDDEEEKALVVVEKKAD